MVWDRHTTHRNLSLVSLVHLCVNGSFVPCQALFFYQRVQLEVGAIPGILPHLGWGTMDHSAVSRSTNQPTNQPTKQATNQPTNQPSKQPTNQATPQKFNETNVFSVGWRHQLRLSAAAHLYQVLQSVQYHSWEIRDSMVKLPLQLTCLTIYKIWLNKFNVSCRSHFLMVSG